MAIYTTPVAESFAKYLATKTIGLPIRVTVEEEVGRWIRRVLVDIEGMDGRYRFVEHLDIDAHMVGELGIMESISNHLLRCAQRGELGFTGEGLA